MGDDGGSRGIGSIVGANFDSENFVGWRVEGLSRGINPENYFQGVSEGLNMVGKERNISHEVYKDDEELSEIYYKVVYSVGGNSNA